MSETNPKHFISISHWQKWLETNHNTENVLWLIIQKKNSKKTGIHYEEAVRTAVSYGWIDGKMKRLNDDEFMQRFTPRRKGSIWSLSNRKRAESLIAERVMTPAGLITVEDAKENGRWDNAYSSRGSVDIPADLIAALNKNKAAQENFQAFPSSARFMYVHWINEAKRKDTRIRRIKTVVYRSERNQRPGIDLRVIKE